MLRWRPTRPSRTNTKKRCPFHHRGQECKSRKSRDTWSNRQVWPWSTKWSRAKANRVLPREHTGHNKHPLLTTQEKTLHVDITDGQHWNQMDYILCSQRWRSSIQSAKTRLGADCDSEHELLLAKFRLKLKKKRGNHYTIQVWPKSNPLQLYSGSFKLVQGIRSDRQSAWRNMDRGLWHCTGGSDQEHPQEKEMQKCKMIV